MVFSALSQAQKSKSFISLHHNSPVTSADYQYGVFLDSLREPSFWELSKDSTSYLYRFIWLPAFDAPICIRIEIDRNNNGKLVVKREIKHDAYYGGIAFDSLVILNSKQVDDINKMFDNIFFWSSTNITAKIQIDGSHWILEGVRGGKYISIVKASPEAGPFKDLCIKLVNISGVKLRRVY